MKTLLALTLTVCLILNSMPSTGQSATDADLLECKRLTVGLNHELAAAYRQLRDSTATLYRLRETLPVREREAERRGWRRGGRDAWEFGGCVAGGAVVGGLFGPPGGLIGAGLGAAVGGVRALVRKWKRPR